MLSSVSDKIDSLAKDVTDTILNSPDVLVR
jgi:hypothetical protein